MNVKFQYDRDVYSPAPIAGRRGDVRELPAETAARLAARGEGHLVTGKEKGDVKPESTAK